ELRQGLTGDAFAPVLLAEPVTHSAFTLRLPADDVPGHVALEDDGPNDATVVRHDLFPMGHEGIVLAGRKRRHPPGVRIELLLEEDRQVGWQDIAQGDFGCHRESLSKSRNAANDGATSARSSMLSSGSHAATAYTWPSTAPRQPRQSQSSMHGGNRP